MSISDQDQDIVFQDSLRQISDTSARFERPDTTIKTDSVPLKRREIKKIASTGKTHDTVSVSARSHISDITFYDTDNIISRIDRSKTKEFPFIFLEKNTERETKLRQALVKSLKEGDSVVKRPFHEDWIIIIVLLAAFFYSSIQAFSHKFFPGLIRFFLFRGIGDPASRETSELFHWQSTIINLISFFNLALFVYCTAFYYGLKPENFSGFTMWTISLGVIVAAVTLRHIACILTGNIGDAQEIFSEYIVTIYLSYRYMALLFFILVILLVYTRFLPPRTIIYIGFAVFGILYLMRILRLFLIFLKRNVSVLYLILYLCALEFLPVVVIIKYFTGLF